MNKHDLITKLNSFSLESILNVESQDPQFISLQMGKSFTNEEHHDILVFLTVINALICYQLSKPGEIYWKEFIEYIQQVGIEGISTPYEIQKIFIDFFKVTKGNKRLQEIKLLRVIKISNFFDEFKKKWLLFYEKQEMFIEWICMVMNQKPTDKTIVFSLKMFNYIGRILTKKVILAPKEYILPIDSRIETLSSKYNPEKVPLKTFWKDIAKEVTIPLIHLDSVLWTDNKLWQ